VRLLGFTTYTPNEHVFAEAVARWQRQKGLPVDGIIGPNTWRLMQTGLGLAPTPSTPSNKIQPRGEIIYKSLFNQTFEPGINISGITQFKPTCDLKDLILGATSAVEGSYDAVNMYDRGIISWGITQSTIHAGGLQNLLYFIRQQRPDIFERHFGSVGLGIQLLKGTAELFYRGQVIPVSQNRQLRTLFRGNPERGKFDRTTIEYWAKIFSRGGRDPEVQVLQREFARKEIERILNKPHKLLQGKSPVNLLGNNYEAQALFYGMLINNPKNAYLHLDRAVKNAGGYGAGTSAIVAAFNSELDNSKFGKWPVRAKKIRRLFNDLRKGCSI
jgi:peptidoglycan hydrolase-like protein with peptidoglycan-binding domain